MRRTILHSCGPLLAATLAACGGGGGSSRGQTPLTPQAALGQALFSDVRLSASGRQSCQNCHDPAAGHAPGNALSAQPGGRSLELQGLRNAPSLRYLSGNRPFGFDAEGAPSGGFFWDGRAATLQAQADGPLLGALEMANANRAEFVARLARAPNAAEFRRVFGNDIFSHPDDAFDRATLALPARRCARAQRHGVRRGDRLSRHAQRRRCALSSRLPPTSLRDPR